jgi:hypothetical protein
MCSVGKQNLGFARFWFSAPVFCCAWLQASATKHMRQALFCDITQLLVAITAVSVQPVGLIFKGKDPRRQAASLLGFLDP